MFPDCVFRENLAPEVAPTALVLVEGGAVSAKEVVSQVARICPVRSTWTWEAVPNGADSFMVAFPSLDDLLRVDGLVLGVPGKASRLVFSQWREEDILHMLELKQIWVHVSGVPRALRHFLGLWAVGSLIGTTVDVDLLALRRRGIIRILVGMSEVDCFVRGADEVGPCIKTDGVLRLKVMSSPSGLR